MLFGMVDLARSLSGVELVGDAQGVRVGSEYKLVVKVFRVRRSARRRRVFGTFGELVAGSSAAEAEGDGWGRGPVVAKGLSGVIGVGARSLIVAVDGVKARSGGGGTFGTQRSRRIPNFGVHDLDLDGLEVTEITVSVEFARVKRVAGSFFNIEL